MSLRPPPDASERHSRGSPLTRLRVVLRAEARGGELALAVLAAALGVVVALCVAVLQVAVDGLHWALLGVPFGARLTDPDVGIPAWRIALVLVLGGLAVGAAAVLARRWRPGEPVDPIEANALHGGRMSLVDSARIWLLCLLSAGVGASVGTEAAVTQLGAGVCATVGTRLDVRRGERRILVGCGAAAAIAALFDAPLAGAFYAFELVLGAYTLPALAPVAAAAVAAVFTQRALFGAEPVFRIAETLVVPSQDYPLFAVAGLVAALLAIGTMQGVTLVERWFRRLAIPRWLRPAAGGALVALLALAYPQVLGSGHGAIRSVLDAGLGLPALLGLLAGKAVASAVSIGSGFRGGMFSTSLLIGALFGAAFGVAADAALAGPVAERTVFVLVGMGAVAAAVVGAPVTMVLLVLETTTSFPATAAVFVGVIAASLTTRALFGYSFATWRFHLRGLQLKGAEDIGWVQDLTVEQVMHRDAPAIDAATPVAELRRRFPAGSHAELFVVDAAGRYLGPIEVAAMHAAAVDGRGTDPTAGDLVGDEPAPVVTPGTTVRAALDLFAAARTETLAVVADAGTRRLLGHVTEVDALWRYSHELERRRQEELGDGGVFGPG